jgi:hypothetical protein
MNQTMINDFCSYYYKQIEAELDRPKIRTFRKIIQVKQLGEISKILNLSCV